MGNFRTLLLCLDLDIPDRNLVRAAGDAVRFRAMKVPPVSSSGAGAGGVPVGAGGWDFTPLRSGAGGVGRRNVPPWLWWDAPPKT
ncbi:hypothetical protein [Kamptonema formosum]|uniref:hypothetical protein n=1 Tax=Kamptonema formosum TaxID=331992 RepID=UPI00036BBDA7|nr:hypothetical protein [Oscillatoria sp. PCC 10802]